MPSDTSEITISLPQTVGPNHTCSELILEIVNHNPRRVTLLDLKSNLYQYGFSTRQIRQTIKDMIQARLLTYHDVLGHTFIVPCFDRPFHIADNIVVKPETASFSPQPDEIVIDLVPGISFGAGDHATTRMAAKGIVLAFSDQKKSPCQLQGSILDIGTGSGILIIIAVLLGSHTGIGIDIDPCAISEARHNVAINRLSNQITVSSQSLSDLKDHFMMIIANIRFPTLIEYAQVMVDKTLANGYLIISGVKEEEQDDLIACFDRLNAVCLWKDCQKQWCAFVFKKMEKIATG